MNTTTMIFLDMFYGGDLGILDRGERERGEASDGFGEEWLN